MSNPRSTFICLSIYEHRPLKLLQADNKYKNTESCNLGDKRNIYLRTVAVNLHKGKGTIKHASQTLRTPFSWLRAVDRRTHFDGIILEVTHGKNVIEESKLDYSFELLYGVQPRISDTVGSIFLPPDLIFTQLSHKASNRINLMLHKQPRDVTLHDLIPDLPTYFCWTGKDGLRPLNSPAQQNKRSFFHITVIEKLSHLIGYDKYSTVPSLLQNPMTTRLQSQNRQHYILPRRQHWLNCQPSLHNQYFVKKHCPYKHKPAVQ